MKKYLAYAVIALIASIGISIAAPDKAAIEAKEKEAWQTFKDKNAEGFKKVVDKDFRGAYAEGISDMAKELSDMKKWDMKSFTISDYTTFSDEKDVMVTTYTVKIEGTFDGKDSSGAYNAGSVWKMEKGAWMAISNRRQQQRSSSKELAARRGELERFGKDVSGDYNCGTVWNLKNGEWRAVFYSDMKKSDQ